MRVLPVRTISGRIVLGFFVLVATFTTVSGYTIYKMTEMGRELRFIRTAYLDVALKVAEARSWQSALVDYLDEPSPQRAVITRNRNWRRRLLEESRQKLDAIGTVPPGHAAMLARMRERTQDQLDQLTAGNALFEAAFAPGLPPEAARATLARLKRAEQRVGRELRLWFDELRNAVEHSTATLETAEERARLATIYLGALAAFIGLLVTAWGVLTLRPIARLRAGVRRVARGEYRERVEVPGATEIAEVAREFNAMAAAIEEREQDLVRSERLAAVGKMAAVITHEIRNPLSSIGLNAELLEEEIHKLAAAGGEDAAPEASGLCRAIAREVDRLTAITEEYLRFARLPRPKLVRERANDVVAGLLEFQREELALAGVRVEAELADDLPPIAADEAQLRQALLNLVRNAADAMAGTGGQLRVVTRAAVGGGVEIAVADTGPGIPAEVQARIFEPFFSTKEGGTGLGLALAHEIVGDHGGRIDVDSSPQGTTFTVRLPAAAPGSPGQPLVRGNG